MTARAARTSLCGTARAATLGLCFLAACSAASEPRATPVQRAIVDGELDLGDPAVVAIGRRRIGCGDPLSVHCTGTLIAPRLVLTAAHCASDARTGSLEILFGSDATEPAARTLRVSAVHAHPDYHADGDAADLAVLQLDESAPVAPVPLGSTALEGSLGQSVRLVGFGPTAPSGEAPRSKRWGTARISEVDGATFRVVPGPSLSCHGDSGGPLFAQESGHEVLIGVTSRGDPGCKTYGRNVRVDAFARDFITPWITRSALPSPAPAAGERVDAAALCTAACAADTDCPRGLVCQLGPTEQGLAPRCVVPGLLAGALTTPCRGDAECDERCVRVRPENDADSCRCHRSCMTQPPEQGCSLPSIPSTGSQPSWWTLVLVLLGGLRFRKRFPFRSFMRKRRVACRG